MAQQVRYSHEMYAGLMEKNSWETLHQRCDTANESFDLVVHHRAYVSRPISVKRVGTEPSTYRRCLYS